MSGFWSSLDSLSMPLFTVCLDYAGGTYVSQVRAASPKLACRKWADKWAMEEVPDLGIRGRELVIEQLRSETITPLKGLKNVWCLTAQIHGKLALINLVRTSED